MGCTQKAFGRSVQPASTNVRSYVNWLRLAVKQNACGFFFFFFKTQKRNGEPTGPRP